MVVEQGVLYDPEVELSDEEEEEEMEVDSE